MSATTKKCVLSGRQFSMDAIFQRIPINKLRGSRCYVNELAIFFNERSKKDYETSLKHLEPHHKNYMLHADSLYRDSWNMRLELSSYFSGLFLKIGTKFGWKAEQN